MELTVEAGGSDAAPDTDDIVPALQEPGEETPDAPETELEEVEHEGKKYKIPKPLKGALLMQADYTRKTQEVAEQRRAVEEAQRQYAEAQRVQAEHLSDFARVVAFNDAIAQFEKADWPQIRANNPQLYNDLWFQYQQTKEARDKAVLALQQKVQQRNSQAQQESARRIEEARSAIQREIRDWSPELAGKLNQFALAQGFTAQELSQVTDPRVIKLLHTAYVGSQAKTPSAAAKSAAAVEAAKPLPTVSGASPQKVKASDPASDRLSADEWAKRRNAELKQKRR